MRRAAGHDLDPAHVLADAAALAAADLALHVDLESGLHEGEETGSHANGDILAEHLLQDALDHDLARGEGEILVHDEGFILEEGSLVAGVGGLIAVDAAGIDEPVGRFVGAHVAYALSGQVGTQAQLLVRVAGVMSFQPVGIHALPRRMGGRKVQCIECGELTGDVIALEDLESHGAERVVQVIAHLGDGMKSACEGLRSRYGPVEVGRDLGALQFQFIPSRVDKLAERVLRLVDRLPEFPAFLRKEIRQFLHQLGQLTLLAQKVCLDVLKVDFAPGGEDHLLAFLEHQHQFLFHTFLQKNKLRPLRDEALKSSRYHPYLSAQMQTHSPLCNGSEPYPPTA